MAERLTPGEIANLLVGKTRDEMIPILKDWQTRIDSHAHSEGWKEGYDAGTEDCQEAAEY